MRKGRWLLLSLMVWVSPHTFADYFLKFETSGASHNLATALSSNSAAWIEVSIVDDFPTDGPVHFENTHIGAFTKVVDAQNSKTQDVDYTKFYVAGVPRSVTVIGTGDGARNVVSFGDPGAFKLPGFVPGIVLPDGLLVTTGLSMDFVSNVFGIYLAASMPVRTIGDTSRTFGIPASTTNDAAKPDGLWLNVGSADWSRCLVGYGPASTSGSGVVSLQSVSYNNDTENCRTYVMAKGKITHVIRFE